MRSQPEPINIDAALLETATELVALKSTLRIWCHRGVIVGQIQCYVRRTLLEVPTVQNATLQQARSSRGKQNERLWPFIVFLLPVKA